MLELRPSCENCNKSLPADSVEAMICTYECTFCSDCVATVLEGVCPNCGGGFCARPVRPAREWRPGVSLTQQPAGSRVVYKPVDAAKHREFAQMVKAGRPG